MNYRIQTYVTFDKEVKKLGKKYKSIKKDLAEFVQQLMQNPDMGTDLGNGYRKIRMSITDKGKGKRAGARIITLNIILSAEETSIGLLYIYDKSERESITDKEIEALKNKCGI